MRLSKTARPTVLKVTAIAGLLGAAGIHFAVSPEHFEEWAAAGWFFLGLATVEAGVGIALWRSRRPGLLVIAIALSVGTILLWGVSRTAGLPFGPEAGMPEAVGLPDATATILEALTAGALLGLSMLGRTRSGSHRYAAIGMSQRS